VGRSAGTEGWAARAKLAKAATRHAAGLDGRKLAGVKRPRRPASTVGPACWGFIAASACPRADCLRRQVRSLTESSEP